MSIPYEQSPAAQLKILYDEIHHLQDDLKRPFADESVRNKIQAINLFSEGFFDHTVPLDVTPCTEKDITDINIALVEKYRERELKAADTKGGFLGWIDSIIIKIKYYINPKKYAPQINVQDFIHHVTDLRHKQMVRSSPESMRTTLFASKEQAISELTALRDNLREEAVGTHGWVPRGESRDLYLVEDIENQPKHYPIEYNSKTGAYSITVRTGEAPFISYESPEKCLNHLLNEKKIDAARKELETAPAGSYVKIQLGKKEDKTGYDCIVVMQQAEGKAGIHVQKSEDPFTTRVNGEIYPGSKEEFLHEALSRLAPGETVRKVYKNTYNGESPEEKIEEAKSALSKMAPGSYLEVENIVLLKGLENKIASFELTEDELDESNYLLQVPGEKFPVEPIKFFTASEKIQQRAAIASIEQLNPFTFGSKFDDDRYRVLQNKFKEQQEADIAPNDGAEYEEFKKLEHMVPQIGERLSLLLEPLAAPSEAVSRAPYPFVIRKTPHSNIYRIVGAPYLNEHGKIEYGIKETIQVIEGGRIIYGDTGADSINEVLSNLGATLQVHEAYINKALGLQKYAESAAVIKPLMDKALDKNTYLAWSSLQEPGKIYISHKNRFGGVVHYELDTEKFQAQRTASLKESGGRGDTLKADIPLSSPEKLVAELNTYFQGQTAHITRTARKLDSMLLTSDIADPYSKMDNGANAWKLQKEQTPGMYTLTVYRKKSWFGGSDQTATCSVKVLPNGAIEVKGKDSGFIVDETLSNFEKFGKFLTQTPDKSAMSPIKEVALSKEQKTVRTALIDKLKGSASKGSAKPAWFGTKEEAMSVLEDGKRYGKYVAKECLLYAIPESDEVGVLYRNEVNGEIVEGIISIDFTLQAVGVKEVDIPNGKFRIVNQAEEEPSEITNIKDLSALLSQKGLKIATNLPSQVAASSQEVQKLHDAIQKQSGYLFNEFTEVGAKTELRRLNKYFPGEVAPRSWLVIPHREEAGVFARAGGALLGNIPLGLGGYAFKKLSGQEDEYLFAVAPASADQDILVYRVVINPETKKYELKDAQGADLGTYTEIPALLTKIGANTSLSLKEMRAKEAEVKKEIAAKEPQKPSTLAWGATGVWNVTKALAGGAASAAKGAYGMYAESGAQDTTAQAPAAPPPAMQASAVAAAKKTSEAKPVLASTPAPAAEAPAPGANPAAQLAERRAPKQKTAAVPAKKTAKPAPPPATTGAAPKPIGKEPTAAQSRAREQLANESGESPPKWGDINSVTRFLKKIYKQTYSKKEAEFRKLVGDAGFTIGEIDNKNNFTVQIK